MVIYEHTEILLPARFGALIFIDGYAARIRGIIPSKNQEGLDALKFSLEPTEELIKRYKLTRDILGKMGIVDKTFLVDDLINLNPDPSWNRWFYIKNWNAQETHATDQIKGIEQIKKLERLSREIKRLEQQNAILKEKLKIAEQNITKYVKENMDTLSPLISKFITPSPIGDEK